MQKGGVATTGRTGLSLHKHLNNQNSHTVNPYTLLSDINAHRWRAIGLAPGPGQVMSSHEQAQRYLEHKGITMIGHLEISAVHDASYS